MMVTLGNAQVQWVNDAGFPANLISDHSLSFSFSLTVELVNGGGCGRLDASLGFFFYQIFTCQDFQPAVRHFVTHR